MWSHINYQQVHHRYPYLSHVYLPSVYEATKEHQPYLVVSGYVRCLASIRGLPYYAAVDDVKPFLQLPDKPVELDVDPHAEIGPTASL
jgi:fatty acid desaturase